MKSKLASSSSYKSTGVKNDSPDPSNLTPQKRAEALVNGLSVDKMWGKSAFLTIVDGTVSDFAFRLLALLALPVFKNGTITLSHKQIAHAMLCSERKIDRALNELETAGHISVSRKHNKRNIYNLLDKPVCVDALEPAGEPVPPVSTGEPNRSIPAVCQKCRRICNKLPVTGVCRTCRTEAKVERTARRVAREEIASERREECA